MTFEQKYSEELKWHKECLRDDIQQRIVDCAQRLEEGVGEGVFVMTPPTNEEHEAYFLAKLNIYFGIWASSWSK